MSEYFNFKEVNIVINKFKMSKKIKLLQLFTLFLLSYSKDTLCNQEKLHTTSHYPRELQTATPAPDA